MDKPPDDPVLINLLQSGDLDSCLRSYKLLVTRPELPPLLATRLPGLTVPGAEWLADAITEARAAAAAIARRPRTERFPVTELPLIPMVGGPAVAQGRAVVLTRKLSLSDGTTRVVVLGAYRSY